MEVPESDLFARIETLKRAAEDTPLSANDAPDLAVHASNLLKICQEMEKLSRPAS